MRLVADANVLLSALIGGRASMALTHDSVEQVYTTAVTLDEVQEYVASLARQKRLQLDVRVAPELRVVNGPSPRRPSL